MQEATGLGASPPALSILHLEMRPNTADSQLHANLEHVKSLGLPELKLFEAHDKTLAICGGGPSLKRNWQLIPPDCDVMALNGAYKFLRSKGRTALYFAMIDARAVNVNFFDDPAPETNFLLASQCHADVYAALSEMFVAVFHLATPSAQAAFPDADLYVGGGGTVGLAALGLAMALGYRKVILYGYDSSIENGDSHAFTQPQNEGQATIDAWVKDRKYTTTHAMAAQTMDFFPFYESIKKIAPDFQIQLIGSGLFYDYVATNNNPATRERELAKYIDAYKDDTYGMSEGRRVALDGLLAQMKGESYLDVSTGRGETMELAKKHGYTFVKGTETVPELCGPDVTQAILPNVPHADKSFDSVSLIEVIEHLLPADIEPALFELTRLAKKHILISAATGPHWMGGVNLHPSARPESEWDELFTKIWGDQVRKVAPLDFSPCWRVDLSQ